MDALTKHGNVETIFIANERKTFQFNSSVYHKKRSKKYFLCFSV